MNKNINTKFKNYTATNYSKDLSKYTSFDSYLRNRIQIKSNERVIRDKRLGERIWLRSTSPHNGCFELCVTGIAAKLLTKMGYQPGGTIGKNKRGITRPIKIIKTDKKAGLGHGKKVGFNYGPKSHDYIYNKTKDQMNMSAHHSVGFAKPKNHKSYVISSGFHQNLIRFTKVEKMKTAKIDELIQIKEGIFIETIKKKMKINRYMNITKAVESTITFLDQSTMYLKLEDLGAIKIEFRRLFIKEYFFKEFDSLLALYGRTKLRRVMKDWNPIREPKKGLLIIMKWAKRLNIGNSLQNLTTHSFCEEIDLALIDIVFLPIKWITQSIWQVHDPKSLVHLIKYWMHLLPISKLNLLYRVILYFINLAVGIWNPKEYKNSVHNLIIPWLPVLENKLETIFQRIRYKVTLVLKNYNITDHLGLLILSPWIIIWGEKNWELFCYRYIIPKLQNHFETKFLFNPEQQNFKPLESILKWHGHINNRLKAQVYDLTFFKLFHQILRLWLSQKQTMKEIIRWFVGWKGFFPQDLLDQKCILTQLVNAQTTIKLAQKPNFKRQRQRQLK